LLGNRKKIAKCLMRTLICRSTFLYGARHRLLFLRGCPKSSIYGSVCAAADGRKREGGREEEDVGVGV
jgi:hypothetical protein